jgi:SWI/SNF-related matrix-associated actin-dependent regulator 1 of chromatin subfamily A
MAISLEKVDKAYKVLKEYSGENSYIISLKNTVYAYKTRGLKDAELDYILHNYDREPKLINKIVKIADWYGEKLQNDLSLEFIPQKLEITWFLGETDYIYHFFCIYRRSQEKAMEVFVPKDAILTDFLSEPWENKLIDFNVYNERSGRCLYPHQEEAVKFLTTKKKAILADVMGFGKTTSAIVAALEDKFQKVLIICPASVKITWKKELMRYVDEDDITIVEGRNWKENRFTIINYDILKNFYEIPTEMVKSTSLELQDGKVTKVTKEKEKVSRKSAIIKEAMENSQLYQSKFDLFIIDVSHRLSNTTSGFFKIMSDLVKRSNPSGIYELSGTPITNRPINFYNLLKLIDAPVSRDWKKYVERYCDGKFFYNRKERDAYSFMYCKKVNKPSWFDLTDEEKTELDQILDKRCKKIWKTDGASHIDELQEVIKSYYLRRDKNDLELKKKTVKILNYKLTPEERASYEKVWDEYVEAQNEKDPADLEKYKKITEGIMMRQWLANNMTSKTIDLAQKCIDLGHKVVIFCSFDEELNTIKEAFKDICVVHNGKMLAKRKDKSVESFQNDPNVKVFIGNIQSAGVGLTLVASRVAIFNSFSWVSGDNLQAEDRIHRLNQKNDVTIYYQVFLDTFYKEMFDKVRGKQEIIDNIIVSEKNK